MLSSTKIVIQARSGSTRLKNKILLPFFEQSSILSILLDKLVDRFGNKNIIVATTNNEDDNGIVDLADSFGCYVFRGSESNVLERFIETCKFYSVDKVIRICSDNPILDLDLLNELIDFHEKNSYDYVSFDLDKEKPVIKTHIGVFAEGTTLSALEKVNNSTQNTLYLEHVTNFLYLHPKIFNVRLINVPNYLKGRFDLRFTIDTIEDFKLMQEIFLLYISGEINCNLERLIYRIDLVPLFKEQMNKQIKKNDK